MSGIRLAALAEFAGIVVQDVVLVSSSGWMAVLCALVSLTTSSKCKCVSV